MIKIVIITQLSIIIFPTTALIPLEQLLIYAKLGENHPGALLALILFLDLSCVSDLLFRFISVIIAFNLKLITSWLLIMNFLTFILIKFFHIDFQYFYIILKENR